MLTFGRYFQCNRYAGLTFVTTVFTLITLTENLFAYHDKRILRPLDDTLPAIFKYLYNAPPCLSSTDSLLRRQISLSITLLNSLPY